MTNPASQPESLASVGRMTVVLTGSALIVQMIGFARQLYLAAELGLSGSYDAFLIALAAPMALGGVLTSGVSAAVVPAYAEAKDERGLADARRLVGTVLVWTVLAGALLSVLLWIFAEPLVALTGPGLAEEGTADEAVGWVRTLAPIATMMAASSIFRSLCQVESLFPAIALGSVLAPLIALAVMVVYWDTLGLNGLVLGTLLGAMTDLGLLAVTTVVRRISPSPRLRPPRQGMRGLLRHAVPISASSVILEANLVFDRAVASWLATGGVSALRYGESLVKLPFAAIRPAWSQALYPALVRADRATSEDMLAGMTERVLRYAIAFFVPMAWLTLAVAPIAVATAYGRGAFTDEDLTLTTAVVAASAPLIVTWTVAPTLVTALNALRKGTVLMAATLVGVSLNLVLNIVLGYLLGVAGVALATTLVSVVIAVFFSRRLASAEPAFRPSVLVGTLVRSSIAVLPSTLVFGVPIWAGVVQGGIVVNVTVLTVVGVAGLGSYYAIARRLGMQEVTSIVAFGVGTASRMFHRLLTRR